MSNDKASAAYHPDHQPTPLVQPPARPTPTQDAVNIVLQREGFGSRDEQFTHPSTNPHLNRARTGSPLSYVERLDAKQENIAYIWLIFFGVIGAHYFYLGRPGKALSYIFTLGYVGIGPLTDIFRLRGIVTKANGKRVGA